MQSVPLSASSRPDEHALDQELRAAQLQKITLETQRLLRESARLLASYEAASRDMARAVEYARACLASSRAVLDSSRQRGR